MFDKHSNKGIISLYIIITLITVGFIGLISFDITVEEGQALPQTLIVDPKGGGDYTKIQYALDNASAGDTIRIYAGTYNESLIITKGLTMIGNSSSNTTISWTGIDYTAFVVGNYINISDLAFINENQNYYPYS